MNKKFSFFLLIHFRRNIVRIGKCTVPAIKYKNTRKKKGILKFFMGLM